MDGHRFRSGNCLNTLNIAEEIVNTLFIGVVGTVGVTLAIAFGIGGIPEARKWWSRILLTKTEKRLSAPSTKKGQSLSECRTPTPSKTIPGGGGVPFLEPSYHSAVIVLNPRAWPRWSMGKRTLLCASVRRTLSPSGHKDQTVDP